MDSKTVHINERKLFNIGLPKQHYVDLFSPVFAILLSFVIAGLVVLISGGNPIEAYIALAKGAFGNLGGLKNTVRYTLPIILLALSFSICSRCGYFNIGQEGQMFGAALAAAWVSQNIVAPYAIQTIVMILFGALAGGFIALLPAIFKFLLGINEIIIAVLMNYIITLLSTYILLYSPIGDPNASMPMSWPIEASINANLMIVAVVIIVVGYAVILQYSVPGFELRMVGKNEQFSRACGLPTIKIALIAAFLGGALSGIAAVGEVAGVYHKMYEGFATGMGFNGMTAALIGKQSPIGMALGALVLGALQSGSVTLSVETNVPAEMVQVVQGFVMFFATVNVLKFAFKKKIGDE